MPTVKLPSAALPSAWGDSPATVLGFIITPGSAGAPAYGIVKKYDSDGDILFNFYVPSGGQTLTIMFPEPMHLMRPPGVCSSANLVASDGDIALLVR